MTIKLRVVIGILVLTGLAFRSSAVQGVQLTFQGSDVVLRWSSQPQQTFIIGYKPNLDATTPWTYLATNLVADAGAETTFTHVGAYEGGGAQLLMLTSGASSESTKAILSKEEIIARRAASLEAAKKATAFLMAQLEAAMAKAKAAAILRRTLREAGVGATTEQGDLFGGGPANAEEGQGGANGPEQSSVGQGYYIVLEYAEDTDNDGLANRIELDAGLNFLKTDSDDNAIADGAEDSDGDGRNNADEAWVGTLIQEPDNEYPPPALPFGTDFYIDETFAISPSPFPGLPAAGSQEMLFLDAAPDMAHGLTVTENSPSEIRVRLHSIYIGPEFGSFSAITMGGANIPQNPFPRPTEEQLRLLRTASGETDIGSGRIGQINQELYDQLPESVLDWASWEAEYGLRKTERLIQEIESGQRQASAAFRRSLRANLVTQAKRLTAATSTLFRQFGRVAARYFPIIGGIMILAEASAIAEQWNNAFHDYRMDIRNGFDTSGSAAIIAALSNSLAPGSANYVLNALLR